MKASVKLALLALLSIVVMASPALWLPPVALATLIFIAALGVNPVRLYRMFLPAAPIIVAISAFQALLQGSGAAIAGLWLIDLTEGGLAIALTSAVRMTLLYLAGSAVTSTTTEGELAGALDGVLRPVDRLTGMSIGRDISTMTVLAIAFIPMVRDEFLSIKMAQEARGVRYSGPVDALKGIYAIALPLLYSLSGRADSIAVAMEARCYGLKR